MNDMERLREAMHRELDGVQPPASEQEVLKRARRRRIASVSGTALAAVAVVGVFALALGSLLPLDGAGKSTLTPGEERPIRTNGEIMYAKYVGQEGWSLFAIDPATGNERRITHGYRDYASDWSPDGTRIVYDSESEDSHANNVVVVNADGSGPVTLTTDGREPNWSPDGSRLVFTRSDVDKVVSFGQGVSGTSSYLYVMNIDDLVAHQITRGDLSDFSPVWSPDGTKIAFLREGVGVMVMNANGSGDPRQLTDAATTEVLSAPDWSPDGTSLVLAVNGEKDGRPGGIEVVSADGSGTPKMVPGTQADYPDYVSNPTWSPDGQWIAYVHGYPGKIVIVGPDGTIEATLHPDPGQDSVEELTWGPEPTDAIAP